MNDFEKAVIEMGKDVAAIKDHIKNSPCQRHTDAIFGNGSMGLKTQVKILMYAGGGAWALILVLIKAFL